MYYICDNETHLILSTLQYKIYGGNGQLQIYKLRDK